MLNVTYYQENANQNHNEVSSHSSWDGYHKKDKKITNVPEDVEKGQLIHCWWEYNLVEPL